MSIESEAAVTELDAALDRAQVSSELADELFALVGLLEGSPSLRRALTDPSTPAENRQALASGLLSERVGPIALQLVTDAVGQRLGGRALMDALERQAVRTLLKVAEGREQLGDVEDELFRFGRVVDGDPALAAAITDRTAALSRREALVQTLLSGKSQPETLRLAQRAIGARQRNFARTLIGYVELAAEMRGRVIATVRVARALDEGQRSRLQAALAQQTGRQVALQEIVEPELVGGIRVEVGAEVIEGTVAGRLEMLRQQFG